MVVPLCTDFPTAFLRQAGDLAAAQKLLTGARRPVKTVVKAGESGQELSDGWTQNQTLKYASDGLGDMKTPRLEPCLGVKCPAT